MNLPLVSRSARPLGHVLESGRFAALLKIGPRGSALVGGGAVALVFVLLTQGSVAGAGTVTTSMDVAGMSFWGDETHIAGACGPIAPTQARELHGTGQGSIGAFISNLSVPNGATLTRLAVVAHDNDSQFGSDAYIVRKRMTPDTINDGLNGGYNTLAHTRTSYPGASPGISRVSTTHITHAKVDTINFSYMAVLVNCHGTVDPIGVQVTYQR